MAVLHFSFRSLNIHFPAFPLRQVPMRSMQHALVANEKRLVQGFKNAVANRKRGVRERFLPFIFHAHECCMAKLVCVR